MKKIRCFVLLPVANRQETLLDSVSQLIDIASDFDRFKAFFQGVRGMIDMAERERGASVIYDSKNIEKFQEEMNTLNDGFISPQYALYELLTNAENIRGKLRQEPYGYYIWNFNTGIQISGSVSILAQIADEILQDEMGKAEKGKELAELVKKCLDEGMKIEGKGKLARNAEIVLEDGDRHVLMHNDSINPNRPTIPVIKDQYPHRDECPRLVCIHHVRNPVELECWIKQNRQPRKFHKHKHGEDGKGAEKNKAEDVSPLLCGKEHAQELLNTAIGDRMATKRLLNFDEEHEKYIVFERSEGREDGLENTYHGYHVENEGKIRVKDRGLLELLNLRMTNENSDGTD